MCESTPEKNPTPALPACGEGETPAAQANHTGNHPTSPPPPRAGEAGRGSAPDENLTNATWQSTASHWEKVKPLARRMRSHPTPSEARLWHAIRNRQVSSTKFRRQHAIDKYIVDFFAPACKLVIEVDGTSHEGKELADMERQKVLENLGMKVLRFTNEDIWRNLEAVLAAIQNEIEKD